MCLLIIGGMLIDSYNSCLSIVLFCFVGVCYSDISLKMW